MLLRGQCGDSVGTVRGQCGDSAAAVPAAASTSHGSMAEYISTAIKFYDVNFSAAAIKSFRVL